MTQAAMGRAAGAGATLGWACYVAASWTWCIGMFLPVLLVRDAGLWAFAVFAVPNVVGAAALAWVMRTPEASRRLLEEHAWAVRAFSIVTVAYQAYFAGWVGLTMAGDQAGAGALLWLVPALAAGLVAALPGRLRGAWLVIAGLVLACSMGVIVAQLSSHGLPAMSARGERPAGELVPMALVCALGFLACPYLDATFHRARLEAGARAGNAFGLGFGWLFALMIVGTLVFTPVLLALSRGRVPGGAGAGLAMAVIGAHIVPQLLLTVRVHALEMPARARVWLGLIAVGAGLLPWVADRWLGVLAWDAQWSGLTVGEVVYRGFLSFYGLVFPAYALVCMTPVTGRDGRRRSGPTRSRVTWWLAACAMAAPFYWVAFVERHTWWVVAGIAVILAAWAGARSSARRLS
jgi:hypothetical protein